MGGSRKPRSPSKCRGRKMELRSRVAELSSGGHSLPLEEFCCKGAETRLGERVGLEVRKARRE